jgi:hypothetical protein
MSTSQAQAVAPPVETLVSEVVATLAFAARAYLGDTKGDTKEEKQPDFAAADLAIGIAAHAFEAVQSRLRAEDRSALQGMLTDLRLTYVKKRGV